MEDPHCCPSMINCQLVLIPDFAGSDEQRKNYIQKYCQSETKKWEDCKRFIVKNTLNFCPDFVMPDNKLSIDEIMDKFDEESLN